MSKRLSAVLALVSLGAVLAVLYQLPLIASVPLLLVWPFVSVRQLVIDGYARFLAGFGLALFTGWNIGRLLPTFIGPSGLVEYGQFMMEAQFVVLIAVFAVALGLIYAGARSLRRAHPAVA